MLEFLLPLFYMLAVGALWRLVGGIVQGMTGRQPSGAPPAAVHMVRDPVCGTYVIPDHAVVISDGRTRAYFCSTGCRDKYRARPSAPSTHSGSTASPVEPSTSSRPERVEGRIA
jgi:YHS domain-containing protein